MACENGTFYLRGPVPALLRRPPFGALALIDNENESKCCQAVCDPVLVVASGIEPCLNQCMPHGGGGSQSSRLTSGSALNIAVLAEQHGTDLAPRWTSELFDSGWTVESYFGSGNCGGQAVSGAMLLQARLIFNVPTALFVALLQCFLELPPGEGDPIILGLFAFYRRLTAPVPDACQYYATGPTIDAVRSCGDQINVETGESMIGHMGSMTISTT